MAAPKDLEASIPLHDRKEQMEDLEKSKLGAELDQLPMIQPGASSKPQEKKKLSATVIIPIWIILSSAVIIYNKYLYSVLDFQYPIFLTTFHMAFGAIGTRILQRTTHLLDGAKEVNLSRDMFVRSILPIGVLFSGSLILSNMAYLSLSVSFIQMLKAFNPVSILLISFAFRIQEPNRRLLMIVGMISGGVAMASYGELHFEMFGFVCQALAVCFESSRLVMIELLLHGLKMDPLVSLHYYAPVCAAINALIIPFTEGLAPFYALYELGPFVLITNAMVAFLLNVSAVFLIGAGSGLILTLAGVFKDILLISGSVIIFASPITPIQIFGYSVALGGLILFRTTGGKK